MTLLKQRDDIGVGKLCKLGVMGADGDKGDRGAEENNLVDLSSQLTDLITSQSAYSASSKIITTANQMMQDLLNIIQ